MTFINGLSHQLMQLLMSFIVSMILEHLSCLCAHYHWSTDTVGQYRISSSVSNAWIEQIALPIQHVTLCLYVTKVCLSRDVKTM